MKCVKDCYFNMYVRTENKDGDILYSGFFCELYDKRLEKKQIGIKFNGNVQLFEIVRCKECENHETLCYNTKMNVYKRMVLCNAKKRMDSDKKIKRLR